MDLFQKIFGLNNNENQNYQRTRNPNLNQNNDERFFPDDSFNRRSFDVFSDPIQMHQYFENQMNEVLKMFGFNGTGEFSIRFPSSSFNNWTQTPIEGESENSSQNVRDQFLKPGYEQPKNNYTEKLDQDLDEKLKVSDFNSVFGESFSSQSRPYETPQPKSFFYGTSQSMKTVKNADGTIETHRTARDNEGNEESSVCHKIGNKEYCVIRKKDKYGKEEVTENFVNMTENEKDMFTKPNNNPRINDGSNPHDIWSKFF